MTLTEEQEWKIRKLVAMWREGAAKYPKTDVSGAARDAVLMCAGHLENVLKEEELNDTDELPTM